ncbi:hypothetical protein Bca52824_073139 [Brassica carinata]|uniref:Uncharacterized protein n=1 Tax=Brassica carinata TaxID=52824 RepID=A0A8X7Q9F9_BRACI|nr:hypothetical protein Bca52824_073139 [Brassica carinata]
MHVLELNQLTDSLSSLDRLKTKCDVDAPVSFVQDLEHHRDDLFSRIYGIELTSFSKQDLLLHPTLDKAFVVDLLVPIASPGNLEFDPHGSNIASDGVPNVD